MILGVTTFGTYFVHQPHECRIVGAKLPQYATLNPSASSPMFTTVTSLLAPAIEYFGLIGVSPEMSVSRLPTHQPETLIPGVLS